MSSTSELFLAQAERKYKSKEWECACTFYDKYFSKNYQENQDMSVDDAKILVHYADALINLTKTKNNDPEKTMDKKEEIETATSYLLDAKATFEKLPPPERPWPIIMDIHEMLGDISLNNRSYKTAYSEFKKAYDIAVEHNFEWKERLSMLYLVAVALESREKVKKAIDHIHQCMAIADEELPKASEEDKQKLIEFKKSFEEKLGQLNEDLEEQQANKDTLNKEEEEEEEEEEEDIDEEEEEEMGEEEENGEAEEERVPKSQNQN